MLWLKLLFDCIIQRYNNIKVACTDIVCFCCFGSSFQTILSSRGSPRSVLTLSGTAAATGLGQQRADRSENNPDQIRLRSVKNKSKRKCGHLLTELIPLSFTSWLLSDSYRAEEQRWRNDYMPSQRLHIHVRLFQLHACNHSFYFLIVRCVDGFVPVWVSVRYQRACAAGWHMTQNCGKACAALRQQSAQRAAELSCCRTASLEKAEWVKVLIFGSCACVCEQCTYRQLAALCWAQRGSSCRRSPHQIGKRWTEKEIAPNTVTDNSTCISVSRGFMHMHTKTHMHSHTAVPADCVSWTAGFLLAYGWDWIVL